MKNLLATTIAALLIGGTLTWASDANAQIMLQCKVIKTGQIITTTQSCPPGTYQIGAINVP